MTKKKPLHLLIRFSDTLFNVGDVIGKHQEVIDLKGCVWFGKIGTPVSKMHISKINEQIQQGIESHLYLVKGNRSISTFYKGSMISLSREFPSNEKDQIPGYYFEVGIIKLIRFWVKLSELIPLEPKDVNHVKVSSSVLPIQESIFLSSSGHFIVHQIKTEEIYLGKEGSDE